jgi:hypothetical protein
MAKSKTKSKKNPEDSESGRKAEPIISDNAKKATVAKKDKKTSLEADSKKKSSKGTSRKSNNSAPALGEATPATLESQLSVPAAPAQACSTEEIALRAYYLGEKRQKLGLPGDTAQDWIAAEQEIAAEAQAARNPVK